MFSFLLEYHLCAAHHTAFLTVPIERSFVFFVDPFRTIESDEQFKYNFFRVDNFRILCTLVRLNICIILIQYQMTVTKTIFLT